MNSGKAQASFQKPLLPFHSVTLKKKIKQTNKDRKQQEKSRTHVVQEEAGFELLVSSLHLPSGGIPGVCTTSGFLFSAIL